MSEPNLAAGVVGVGAMGTHHARVYNELPAVDLVGVADEDSQQAAETADSYGTASLATETLLDRADVVSVAVPTRFHHEVASAALERETSVLVEKPFVSDIEKGLDLLETARATDQVLQVGHIERFNPVVDVVADLIDDLDVIAVAARRLGPPVDRDGDDDIVMDLMIHDIDVVLSLIDRDPETVTAMSARDEDHVTAQFQFEGDVVGTLTASRVTQDKIRDLAITARDCRVHVDYMAQSVEIHRHSHPSYQTEDGDVRFRNESVIERPAVDSEEPLKRELRSFVSAVRNGEQPAVTAADGLRAISVAQKTQSVAYTHSRSHTEVNTGEYGTV